MWGQLGLHFVPFPVAYHVITAGGGGLQVPDGYKINPHPPPPPPPLPLLSSPLSSFDPDLDEKKKEHLDVLTERRL